MPTRKEILEINGREVTVTNPDKVYFPDPGYTKMDLVNYYLAVSDGALRGAGGRPMALKRFVDGITKEPFFQKRAPDNRPEWLRIATLTFPSGRTADEIVIDDAAGLAWVVEPRLHRPQPAPGPGRRPRPSRRAAGRPRPGAGDRVAPDPRRRAGRPGGARGRRASSAGRRRRARAGSTSTSGSSALDLRGGSASCPGPRPRRRGEGADDRDQQVVEGGAPRRLPRLQPEREGPDGGLGLLRAAAARRPGVVPAALVGGRRRRARGLHDRDGARAVRRAGRCRRRHRRSASARSMRCSS